MTARQVLAEIEARSNASTIGKSAWRNLDAALIDIRKLVAALRAVLDLHHLVEHPDPRDEPGEPEYYGTDRSCCHCGGVEYPCATVTAITEALGGGA